MTILLEKAMSEARDLSEQEQDMIARHILAVIQDEREWDRQFRESQDILGEMADEALAAYEAGLTTRLA